MTVYFLRLDHFSILPMLLNRMAGRDVAFLDCSPWYQKEALLKRLSKVGIAWLSHNNGILETAGSIPHAQHIQSLRIGRQLFNLQSFHNLTRVLGGGDIAKTSVFQRVLFEISAPVELLHTIAPYPSSDTNAPAKVWMPNTAVTRSLLVEYPAFHNKCPRILTTIELLIGLLIRLVRSVLERTVAKLMVAARHSGGSAARLALERSDGGAGYRNAEIAYFPNFGVFYSRLYLKDHYYSKDPASPFFCEKIAHFELHGNEVLPDYCLEYYRAKGIRSYDWRSLPASHKTAMFATCRLLLGELKRALRGIDATLLLAYSKIAWEISVCKARLCNLPNLKLVLIGADLSFPQTLAAACASRRIETVAVQERMNATWFTTPIMVDHHFVIGPLARDYLMANAPTKVAFHELGPVRLRDHALAKAPLEIAAIRQKYKAIVLALDFHSVSGWFENGRCIANSWYSNGIFYDHVLRLCEDFQQVFFLLKGKNANFLQLAYFADHARKLRAKANLLILENAEHWTPFSSASAADIAIARYTSLADEMLALGKPVIFDDYDGFPGQAIDFGSEVLARNYAELKAKLAGFLEDPETYNRTLDSLRRKFYFIPNRPVEHVLHDALATIWDRLATRGC